MTLRDELYAALTPKLSAYETEVQEAQSTADSNTTILVNLLEYLHNKEVLSKQEIDNIIYWRKKY